MKIKLPKPFYTARVGEGLSSLTNYVREATRIADEIKPVQSSDSPLKPDPDSVPPAPKLHHVTVNQPWSNTSLSVTVKGEHLEHVQSFALIPTHDLSDGRYSLPAHVLKFQPTGGLADFKVPHHVPPPGPARKQNHYHAWVQDIFGQEDLLFNAIP